MKNKDVTRYKALGIFIILFCIFLLCFNGISSTDDEQLYIALTGGLATGKGYSGLPLLGNDRLQGNTGSVEPFHPLLGIPLFFIAQLIGAGTAQAMFILPAIYTALTAMLIYLVVCHQGYTYRTALFSAFAYGLGTIAFAYARMNFREPLAALFIMLAVYFMEIGKSTKDLTSKHFLIQLISFLSLGLAALSKITTIVILPIFFITFFSQNVCFFQKWKKKEKWQAITLLTVLVVTFSLILIILPSESISRFTLRFVNYIRYTLPRLPHTYFWQAIAAQLFSPGKGLFVYSPILLLIFISPFYAKNKGWIFGLAALLILAATQALIYNEYWWGITWGTRALLPVLPLVMLSITPAIDHFITNKRRGTSVVLIIFLALSIIIQAGSLFATAPVYAGWATQATGKAIDTAMQWDIFYSPLFRYFWLGSQDIFSNLAWFHLININLATLILFIFTSVLLIIIALFILINAKRRKHIPLITAIICIIQVTSLLILVKEDTRYYSQITSIEETKDSICELASSEGLIFIDHYLHPFWWYYSNFSCPHSSWAGLPYVHQTAIHIDLFYPRLSNTEQIASEWLQTGNVFLVTTNQNTEPSYLQELSERGFSLHKISENKIEPFIIFQLSKNTR